MSTFQEIYKAANKVKVSVIMQVNLEAYPGSRDNAVNKFTRAVESFRNQIYPNSELIIVADGCNKTYQLYNRHFKSESNIRFVYFDRHNSPKMYEEINNAKYFRGFARGLGVAAATGDLITYMDSDDYLMPDFTLTCMLYYNASPESDWWINTSWFDHENVVKSSQNITAIVDPNTIENVQLKELPGHNFKPMKLKEGKMVMTPWLFTHKAGLQVKWRDVISSTVSEDVDFYQRVSKIYKKGLPYAKPTYVRCHYSGHWDI